MVNYADDLDSNLSVYEDKPKWLYCGQIRLMETRSGYGMKLTSDYKVKFMGKNYDGIHRMTFLIDENRKIEQIWEKVNTKEHAKEILDFLK